ncbi:hypothetical protein CCM_08401 [Cordyceps militaris CM01]|uniref:Uncharacterized protein n=1 Tax=Cordyceps militaris (strain CM01) TaxID=983644 RepID=G3JR62_CORMM|nr:uncharacterized protein CCM_08401 [Cordyceps militaris CM01]EGX88358.1 hypothetical protein CCM_08401 [Cordyceps militaris CM01]
MRMNPLPRLLFIDKATTGFIGIVERSRSQPVTSDAALCGARASPPAFARCRHIPAPHRLRAINPACEPPDSPRSCQAFWFLLLFFKLYSSRSDNVVVASKLGTISLKRESKEPQLRKQLAYAALPLQDSLRASSSTSGDLKSATHGGVQEWAKATLSWS